MNGFDLNIRAKFATCDSQLHTDIAAKQRITNAIIEVAHSEYLEIY